VSGSSGRAIAEAVSRWPPTAAARVRARVWPSGAGFLRVLRFPLPIHSTKFSILTITRGKYNRPRINGRRAERTQFRLHPPLCKLKKKSGSSSPGRVKNFHFIISSRPALGSTQPPIKWVPGALSRVKLTTHLQLVPRSRKCGSIHPLPHTSSWCNV
jgi:hypothetical protein